MKEKKFRALIIFNFEGLKISKSLKSLFQFIITHSHTKYSLKKLSENLIKNLFRSFAKKSNKKATILYYKNIKNYKRF